MSSDHFSHRSATLEHAQYKTRELALGRKAQHRDRAVIMMLCVWLEMVIWSLDPRGKEPQASPRFLARAQRVLDIPKGTPYWKRLAAPDSVFGGTSPVR